MASGLAELEQAMACDRQGLEAEAILHYRRALELGLPEAELSGALLGLGSSLRNVGEFEEALEVPRGARERFPGHEGLRVFLAYALWSSGRQADGMRELVETLLDLSDASELKRHERAIRLYAEELH